MINAKTELLDILGDLQKVKCASIKYAIHRFDEKDFILKVKHTKKQFEAFLCALDFEYDNGYGSQELYGTVWLKDGTWLSRGEYDGSEWWEHNKLPEIPKECYA